MCLMVVGEVGNFVAYGYAPASIVSPLGVVALISNCIVAPIFFHEAFAMRDLAGVVTAVAGAVTVVISSSTAGEAPPPLGPRELLVAVSQISFEVYVGLTVTAMGFLAVASNRYGERWIVVDICLVALFGGYTALSTKAVSGLLTMSLYRVVTIPIVYPILAVLVLSAVMQVKYLSRALQRFPSTKVIPTHFVFFTLSVIVGSAILYQDFDNATAAHLVLFVSGCALTFTGVWLITSGSKSAADDDDDDDEEAAVGSGPGKYGATPASQQPRWSSEGRPRTADEADDYFMSVAAVNLDRSNGARTPNSFYDEVSDAEEIGDAAELVAERYRNRPLLRVPTNDENAADDLARGIALPAAYRPEDLVVQTGPFNGLPPGATLAFDPGAPLSPRTQSRTYFPGAAAGMGMIVDSVVRDRERRRNRVGERKRRKSVLSVDARLAPLQPTRSNVSDSGVSQY
ncbi:magnesium transporter NIPA-domain-containing protein [Dipodascopsis tothii]|uniref:magnesium transporter NIPA-domain-containing protein n=1 Tax=Dipodascopsis tothii TaxID=44089 RepID=UPI0034CF719F